MKKTTTVDLGFDPKLFVESIAHEKGLSKDEVYSALGTAIETAIRRDFPEGTLLNIRIQPEPFAIYAQRKYLIVDKVEDFEVEITKKSITTETIDGDYALEDVPVVIDRQKLNIVRQVILQRLKQVSRSHLITNLLSRKNTLFYGTVKVVKREQILIECEGLEVNLPRKNCIGREKLVVNQRVFFVLEEDNGQYVASRSNTDFLKQVLRQEIYAFENEEIEVTNISRIAGFRSKVIVRSNNGSDPLRICIGQGAKNVRAVQEYLSGEYVDFIEHKDDLASLMIEAFKPVQLTNIQIDENSNSVRVCVSDEDIGRAIGKYNNNINLINGLTTFEVEAVSASDWDKKEVVDNTRLIALFKFGLSCDDDLAQILIDNNFSSLEEVAYVPEAEFDIDELDEETISALRSNARDTVENAAELQRVTAIADLAGYGFNNSDIAVLAENEVTSLEDVADLGTFDLTDILPELSEEQAQEIIMKARKHDPRFAEA